MPGAPRIGALNISYLENIALITPMTAKKIKNINGIATHMPRVLNTQKSATVKSNGTGHSFTLITLACAELPSVNKYISKISLFILFFIMI